jgi:hypothetical protein
MELKEMSSNDTRTAIHTDIRRGLAQSPDMVISCGIVSNPKHYIVGCEGGLYSSANLVVGQVFT